MSNRSLLALAAVLALLPFPVMAGAGGWFAPPKVYWWIPIIIVVAAVIYLIWGRGKPKS